MEKSRSLYWTLFTSTFYLSAFTFGGGYVIVPLMEKRFVQELGWIDEDQMLDIVAIGQSSPGPIAVNTSILVGYRMAGVPGALVTVLGTILPPLVIMTLVTYFYLAVRDNPIVHNLLLGMQAGVAAIIVNVVWNMAMRIIKQKRVVPILVMAVSLVAGIVFDVNILYLLLFAGIIGAVTTFLDLRNKKGGVGQ
ncbi:chromate transporter [Atopococcus tabaci]|uniref:chromate transporter n=1 Tax=Atopococcus tabaci TaxID=269774 RepID=UPI0004178C84|nr:chromate transporter [Atopococcus tabaci]